MSGAHDPGLHAVARVREVRERDSRLGLQQALTLTQERERAAAAAQHDLTARAAFTHGPTPTYLASRHALAAMAARAQELAGLAAASRTSTEEARRRWQQDRTRLRAVESLLERRAEERRVEADRRESRELDDVAGRLWLRGRARQGATP